MIRSIVVGTDGSETAGKAVAEAAQLAAQVRAVVEIVTAYAPKPNQRVREEARQAPEDLQWMMTGRSDVEEKLAQARRVAEDAGVREVNVHAREGDPADAILDVAEERGSDLIVVGNKGMSGAKRFLLGSVPNKVSHHAPCSVLIVRTT